LDCLVIGLNFDGNAVGVRLDIFIQHMQLNGGDAV